MFVKQIRGKVFGAQFTKKEQQAIDMEVKKYVAEQNEIYNKNLDAVLLYTLRKEFGFGAKRLKQFYDSARNATRKFHEEYGSGGLEEFPNFCKRELLRIGVDLDKWEES